MATTAPAQAGASDQRPRDLLTDPEFVALASLRFVSSMAFATVIIALALYADLFEASGLVAGLFGTAYAIVRLALVLPLGRKLDLGNSKRWLLGGLALNIALLVGYVFVGSIEHVVFLRGFQAIGAIILWVGGLAVVGEIAPDDGRGLWVGTYNQVSSLASLTGDIVGGALLYLAGFTLTYSVLIGLTLISVVMVWLFLRDDPGVRADPDEATGIETYRRLLARKTVISLVVFRFAFSFGKMAVVIFLPIYARTEFGMNAFLIGGILAGGKLTKGLAQGYVGKLADRTGGYEWYIFAGTVGYALGTALIPAAPLAADILPTLSFAAVGLDVAIAPAFLLLFVAYSILGIADSLRLPTSMALFVREGEHYDAVAGSLSLRSVSWQVGAIFGPVVVGGVFDSLSYLAGFWLAGAFMLAAGTVFLWLYDTEPAPEGLSQPSVGD